MNAVSISADRLVLLGRVAPIADDGLLLQGIATTRHWRSWSALVPGLLPKKVRVELPIPLFWNHEPDRKIGEVFALAATDLTLAFMACVVPPDTAGYDSELLSRVWRDVRTGKTPAVSIGVRHAPTADGSWRLDELSVCVASKNRFARITKIKAPDGQVVKRSAPIFTADDARSAWLAFQGISLPSRDAFADFRHAHTLLKNATRRLNVTEGPASIYVGNWRPGEKFFVGHTVTYLDSLWHCDVDGTPEQPGMGSGWRRMTTPVLEGERKLAAVEARSVDNPPPSRYRGVYKAGEKYRWADEVTYNGCRWWAKWDTDKRPGDGEGNGWQLTHKSLERERARR